jgi:hypothetical protein
VSQNIIKLKTFIRDFIGAALIMDAMVASPQIKADKEGIIL